MNMRAAVRALGILLLASSTAQAKAEEAKAPTKPTPWLKATVEEAKKLAERKVEPGTEGEKQWKADIKKVIDDILDWDELTERSLGRYWKDRSDQEKETFSKLLREMIEASYQSKLQLAARDKVKKPEEVKIQWLTEKVTSKSATATCEVKADKTTVGLGFKMRWNDNRWRVYDVSIDDVSTVRTYRSQFGKIISKEGFDALLDRMRKKTQEIREGKSDLLAKDEATSAKN